MISIFPWGCRQLPQSLYIKCDSADKTPRGIKIRKKILITSALPYVNNVPHLGNIIGSVLSADVFARYCRSRGYDTLYVCGTDEHGTATETKAMEEGVSPQEICYRYYRIHKEIYEWFRISFDAFGRTTTKEQTEVTQDIFLRLRKNGYITEESVEQMYCSKCEKFRADRFVLGICPFCGYENARGDQCESCSKLLNATELKSPKCKVCGTAPVIKESEHLFIDLPKMKDRLLEWVNRRSKEGKWSANAKTMTYSWIRDGLKKRCISRDLSWGVPIPLEKYKNKVFYVWFDAPIGYISITKHARKDWEQWWKDDRNVRLYQFMGKDNIPFHTILFPASLIGADDNYTLLYRISSTEYLNYETGKFSKSRGEGVFGDDAIKLGLGPDVLRYYLIINRPEKSDSVFSWDDLREKANNELVANLGNLVNRTISFTNRFFGGIIPKPELSENDMKRLAMLKSSFDKVTSLLEEVELKEALKAIMQAAKQANQYFQEEEPWKKIKTDPLRAGTALFVLSNIIKDLAILLEPFLPSASEAIFSQLSTERKSWEDLGKLSVGQGRKIGREFHLFSNIEQEKTDKWRASFSCRQEKANKPSFPLMLRVGVIRNARPHPKADKLLVLDVELGDEKRQLVAGLRQYYKESELLGKHIVVVSNLKPAKLRGIESQGMLLAAEDSGKVALLEAPGSPSGDMVYAEGLEQSSGEITFEEFSRLKLAVKDGKATFDNRPLRTGSEPIVMDGVRDGATIR